MRILKEITILVKPFLTCSLLREEVVYKLNLLKNSWLSWHFGTPCVSIPRIYVSISGSKAGGGDQPDVVFKHLNGNSWDTGDRRCNPRRKERMERLRHATSGLCSWIIYWNTMGGNQQLEELAQYHADFRGEGGGGEDAGKQYQFSVKKHVSPLV